jgi:sodium transport system permease protein
MKKLETGKADWLNWSAAWAVLKKEILDALRDRKTLISVLLSSVLVGPVMLVMLSMLFAQIEDGRDQRVLYIQGQQHAPALVNFFQRQSFEIKDAPPNFEQTIRDGTFSFPVLIVPPDFGQKLSKGEPPELTVMNASTNRPVAAGAGRIMRLISEFNRENSRLELAVQGVASQTLRVVEFNEVDLSSAQSRAAQFTSILPIFIVMAILYGALNAALDTTAGERERGSLEPLLMNPMSRYSLVIGKWGAVAAIAMLTATFAVLSFFPAQWLIQTDTLKSMFNFGWREALGFLLVLLPFAASTSALFMAVAIRCKTFKEAHANNTFVILAVSMMPLISVFDPSGDRPWYYWVPGLAQQLVMNKVLKFETLSLQQVAIPALVSIIIALLCIQYIERRIKQMALK